tara:strand:- start:176 stop:343 length:168 start_codon:yes stop_codon:yes gene_type:complete
MNRNLIWLHVDEAGRPLRPYSRLREFLRIMGVLAMALFVLFSLWCAVALTAVIMP